MQNHGFLKMSIKFITANAVTTTFAWIFTSHQNLIWLTMLSLLQAFINIWYYRDFVELIRLPERSWLRNLGKAYIAFFLGKQALAYERFFEMDPMTESLMSYERIASMVMGVTTFVGIQLLINSKGNLDSNGLHKNRFVP